MFHNCHICDFVSAVIEPPFHRATTCANAILDVARARVRVTCVGAGRYALERVRAAGMHAVREARVCGVKTGLEGGLINWMNESDR